MHLECGTFQKELDLDSKIKVMKNKLGRTLFQRKMIKYTENKKAQGKSWWNPRFTELSRRHY